MQYKTKSGLWDAVWHVCKHMAETRQKAYVALLNASSNPDRVLMLRNTCYLLKRITKLQFTVHHYEDSDSLWLSDAKPNNSIHEQD